MAESETDLLIIGAGQAGTTLATTLRQSGFEGRIALVGEEAHPPYQRPPLSKAWLQGEARSEMLHLKSLSFYADNGIDLKIGNMVSRIDADARRAFLADGSSIRFGTVVLSTGARARPLPVPGADASGAHYLRTIDDAEQLQAALAQAEKLIVVGGGYLGLEVAAAARTLGVAATVVEREARLLARVAATEISEFFHQFHQNQGVSFEMGHAVTRVQTRDGRATAVELDDGRILPADTVLVSIGAIPNDALARELGCACEDGIIVDALGRTSVADVFAIGDVTRRPLEIYGNRMARLESVPSALEQARILAHVLTNREPPATEVPWFWSDQYDLKLQIAGLVSATDRTLLRGSMENNRFAIFHLDADNIIQAVEAVNSPPEFMFSRRLIANRTAIDPAKLVDPEVPIREIVAS